VLTRYRPDDSETIRPSVSSTCAGRRPVGSTSASRFLLVFYSNRSPRMHRFELEAWNRQTDLLTDGLQHCLMSLMGEA